MQSMKHSVVRHSLLVIHLVCNISSLSSNKTGRLSALFYLQFPVIARNEALIFPGEKLNAFFEARRVNYMEVIHNLV